MHRLAVHRHQTAGDHGEQWLDPRRQSLHPLLEGVLLGGQHVQHEMVGRVGRQLFVPGVHQFAAQQGDQRHRQQDQAEGQALPGGGQRMPQQLAEAEAPGQAGLGQ
ncbi:hypothetical protein D9M72_612280 [compost metagenome]